MKKILFKSKLILLCVAFLTVASCSTDDDAPAAKLPTVSYAVSTFESTFFQAGFSGVPTTNWNGDQGSFSLVTPLTGLSINATNGTLVWTKDLPIGTHNIQVLATNSNGQTITNVTINNPFQGVFTGILRDSGNDLSLDINFNTDETVLISVQDTPQNQTGTWIKNGNTIEVDFTFADTGDAFKFLGFLSIGTNAVYAGNWTNNPVLPNTGDTFSVTLN